MTEFKAKSFRIAMTMNGDCEITFISHGNTARSLETLGEGELLVSVKKWREKRSLSQNSYLWVLIGDIGKKLTIPKEDVYKSYIRDYGQFEMIELPSEAVKRFSTEWSKKGIGWFVDVISNGERAQIAAYYGSSSYDTSEMSKVLDAVIRDCEEMGIPTLTEEQIKNLPI